MSNIIEGNLGLAETLAHTAYGGGATCLASICKAFGGFFGLKPSPVLTDILSEGEVEKVNLSCGEKRISRRKMSRRNSREGRMIKPSPVLSDILSEGEVGKNKPSPVLTDILSEGEVEKNNCSTTCIQKRN